MRIAEANDWRATVFRALKQLERGLDRPASYRESAEEAGYSPYHFHRIFKEMTGDSVAEYGRRLRLEQSARMLRGSRTTVSAIAVECGFESLEAFCRAFRLRFGMSPSAFRRQRGPGTVLAASSQGTLPWEYHRNVWVPLPLKGGHMTVHIVEIPPMRVLSMRIVGDYGQMPETWGRIMRYVHDHELGWPGMQALSAFWDHTNTTPEAEKRVDICVTVPDDVNPPDGEVKLQTLPGGLYAVHTFRGDCEGIGPVWDRFRETWFEDAGWSIRPDLPSLEWYRASGNVPLEHNLTDLCDPVEPARPGARVPTT